MFCRAIFQEAFHIIICPVNLEELYKFIEVFLYVMFEVKLQIWAVVVLVIFLPLPPSNSISELASFQSGLKTSLLRSGSVKLGWSVCKGVGVWVLIGTSLDLICVLLCTSCTSYPWLQVQARNALLLKFHPREATLDVRWELHWILFKPYSLLVASTPVKVKSCQWYILRLFLKYRIIT